MKKVRDCFLAETETLLLKELMLMFEKMDGFSDFRCRFDNNEQRYYFKVYCESLKRDLCYYLDSYILGVDGRKLEWETVGDVYVLTMVETLGQISPVWEFQRVAEMPIRHFVFNVMGELKQYFESVSG